MNKYFVNQIKDAVEKHTGLKDPKVQIPNDESFGHFTTTAPLQLKSQDEDIQDASVRVEEAVKNLDFIGKIHRSKNGFVNMWIDNSYFVNNWETVYKEILSDSLSFEKHKETIDDLNLYNINYCYSRIKSILRVLSHKGHCPSPDNIDEKSLTNKDLQMLRILWNINHTSKENLKLNHGDILDLMDSFYDYLSYIKHKDNDINIGLRLSMIESMANIIKLWAYDNKIEIKERM